tara:strand:- start:2475 stop:3566 length:1092 start_codon:yes stop_codon:yes gene_type:complete
MKVTVFGHPFSPIGMGEQLASFSDSLSACYFEHEIFDIYSSTDSLLGQERAWLKPKLTSDPNNCDIRIFHINGDEIDEVLTELEKCNFELSSAYNIIMPAWELETYPERWHEGINLFNEVWAISDFVKTAFDKFYTGSVRLIGQSCERKNGAIYTRKYFGLRDSSHVILGFFDESSYFTRKNPYALLELLESLERKIPDEDYQIVIKTKNVDSISSFQAKSHSKLKTISGNLTYDEITSLISCSDTFVSLHRSEGLGRGGAEAILLEKNAVVTNYSGVLEYTAHDLVHPVDYKLVKCNPDDYPYCEGQHWAEPSLTHATEILTSLIIDNSPISSNKSYPNSITRFGVGNRAISAIKHIKLSKI